MKKPLILLIAFLIGCGSKKTETTASEPLEVDTTIEPKTPLETLKENPKNYSKEQVTELCKGLDVKYDEMESTYFIQHPSSPKYINYEGVYLMIHYKEKESPYLFFKLHYSGDDWLFMKTILTKVDGKDYELTMEHTDRETIDGGVSETFTEYSVMFPWIETLKEDTEVKIRVKGDYYKDYTLTKDQKRAMIEVRDAYNRMIK